MNTATAVDYSNQRRHMRVYLGTDVAVVDTLTGKHLGEIANVTIGGLMLVMRVLPAPGSIYQMAITLPEAVNEHTVINIGADCLWGSESSVAGQHWAGFQIIDASDVAEDLLQHLIDTYGTI